MPLNLKEPTEKLIKELLKEGVISREFSRITSPAFIIRKKNDDLRLVVDYRVLNKHTIKNNFPIPKIQDHLIQLGKSKVFSQIDLRSGYYQIEMNKKDKEKTAFILLNKIYVFNRMPFGLSNAPSTFQECMTKLFDNNKNVKVYLDDILIHSKNMKEHYLHLKEVLTTLKRANAAINFDKSTFATNKVSYLGHIITDKGILPDTTRIKKLEIPTIKNKKDVQRILGLINWFRPFIRDLSNKIAPLTEKLKKSQFKETPEEDKIILQQIFDEIKKQTLLNYPICKQPFELCTDASDYAIGAVLTQNEKLIGFYSYKFKNAETNYTTTEKETLAIIKSITFFQNIIYGSKVKVFTDNQNLMNEKDVTKRINRWKLILSEHDIKISFKRGQDNIAADAISRFRLLSEQNHSQTILNKLKVKYQTHNNKIKINSVVEENRFLEAIHEELIHPGKGKTLNTLRPYFIIKNLGKRVQTITDKCHKCQKNKHYKSSGFQTTGRYSSNEPLTKIACDIKGPIATNNFKTNSNKLYFYLLVMTDIYSRYTEVRQIFNIHSKTIIKTLEEGWLNKHTTPQYLLTDQGRQFVSTNFKDFTSSKQIKHIFTTPYNPQCNGIVERTNKTIGEVLRLYKNREIKEVMEAIHKRLNFTAHSSTKLIPKEVITKKSIFDDKIITRTISEEKRDNITKQIISKNNLKKDDAVFIRTNNNDKMKEVWEGPFTITEVPKDQNYVTIKKGNKMIKTNVRLLRRSRM